MASDLLPNEMAPAIATMIEQGLAAMKKTLERAASFSYELRMQVTTPASTSSLLM